MTQYASSSSKVSRAPATSRTWKTVTFFQDCGVVRDVERHTVTLTMTAAGIVGEVDGQQTSEAEAVAILNHAERVEVIAEVLVPQIGNAAACELHRELGRLGYRAHYALAAQVLVRPVPSFAALTADQAATVRSYAYGQLGLMTGSVAA